MALIPDRIAQRGPARDGMAFLAPLAGLGLVLAGVGFVDLALAWIPLQFGRGEWEFGMASRTFDSLALVTTGLVFIAAAAVAREAVAGLRGLAISFAVLFATLIGVYLLYLLNAPVALRAAPPEARELLQRAMFRTSSFAVMYLALYGWLSWFTWRRASDARRATT